MGSSHMLRASPGQLGCVYLSESGRRWGVFMCMHSCVCLCIRNCSKRQSLWRLEYNDHLDVAHTLICASCVCVSVLVVDPRGSIWCNTAMAPVE